MSYTDYRRTVQEDQCHSNSQGMITGALRLVVSLVPYSLQSTADVSHEENGFCLSGCNDLWHSQFGYGFLGEAGAGSVYY